MINTILMIACIICAGYYLFVILSALYDIMRYELYIVKTKDEKVIKENIEEFQNKGLTFQGIVTRFGAEHLFFIKDRFNRSNDAI